MKDYCGLRLKIKYFFKKRLGLPIYRKDILRYACENSPRRYNDIVWAIKDSLRYFELDYSYYYLTVYDILPEFGKNIGEFVGFDTNLPKWWDSYEWTTSMENYFKWLIEYYRYDKTDVRKIENEARKKFG